MLVIFILISDKTQQILFSDAFFVAKIVLGWNSDLVRVARIHGA